MSKFLYAFVLILLGMPGVSHALVDMRNANFSESWTDLHMKSSAYDLKVQRTYNSRTLYNGMFGFGWCSEYETSLKVTAENTLRITECGAGFELDYLPVNYSKGSFEKNISSIMREVRKRNKGREESYFKNLEKQLHIDTALRDEFSKQLNISGSVKENAKYVANGRSTDFIVFKNNEYVRNLPNGTYQKFDKNGHLTYASDQNLNFIKLTYHGDKLATVTDSTGSSLSFKYYNNSKFVKQITGPSGLSATYKYTGETLTEATNAWKNTYKYEYDDLYNMTKSIYPDGSYFAITYNKDKDWVTSFRDVRGCKENYKYSDNEKDPLNNYSSRVEKVCNGKITNNSSYEFLYKKRADGTRYLAKTKAVSNGHGIETTYHESFGRPIAITQDNMTTRFSYYPNGLLKTKVNNFENYAYNYDKVCNKVASVVLHSTLTRQPSGTTNPKAKPVKVQRSLTTKFLYDKRRCNLVSAKNSDGQLASLTYDLHGRITRILDQSKKEVTITYDERFGKPHVVTRPGLGSITFKYAPDGTVETFDSKEDPLIAVQVASIFSNLLEIIAPATTDANSI